VDELFSNFADFASKSKLSQREVEVGQRLQSLDKQFRFLMDKFNKENGSADREGPSLVAGTDTTHLENLPRSSQRRDMRIRGEDKQPHTFEHEHAASYASFPAYGPVGTVSSLTLFKPHLEADHNFSTRLKFESLQRGYKLITTPGTPLPILCQVFRYCIFHNTREHIMRKIEYHLQKPGKEDHFHRASTNIAGGVHMDTSWPWEGEKMSSLKPQNAHQPQLFAQFPGSGTSSDSGSWAVEFNVQNRDSVLEPTQQWAKYVSAEEVEQYLSTKGLDVRSASGMVKLTTRGIGQTGSPMSVFDEVRAAERQVILVNVGRLFHGEWQSYLPFLHPRR
jgi:hypothetical protein